MNVTFHVEFSGFEIREEPVADVDTVNSRDDMRSSQSAKKKGTEVRDPQPMTALEKYRRLREERKVVRRQRLAREREALYSPDIPN